MYYVGLVNMIYNIKFYASLQASASQRKKKMVWFLMINVDWWWLMYIDYTERTIRETITLMGKWHFGDWIDFLIHRRSYVIVEPFCFGIDGSIIPDALETNFVGQPHHCFDKECDPGKIYRGNNHGRHDTESYKTRSFSLFFEKDAKNRLNELGRGYKDSYCVDDIYFFI